MDKGTTGDDYSNDVWARARFYAALMGARARHALGDTWRPIKPVENITVPRPRDGRGRGRSLEAPARAQGAAVRELQEMLMTLKYLELTEEQKATGPRHLRAEDGDGAQSSSASVTAAKRRLEIVTATALRQVVAGAVKRGADNQSASCGECRIASSS